MAQPDISIQPLNPVIGAVVAGVDLSEPTSPETFKTLHSAWLEHVVLFFRDQDRSLEQHKSFGRLWGNLHAIPRCRRTRDTRRCCTFAPTGTRSALSSQT